MEIRALDRLDREADETIELIARRMHLTLVEVLDEERANALYSNDELIDRVRWHLDDVPGRRAAVYVSVEPDGEITGHTIVRAEEEDGDFIGLFSTTYVDPKHRHAGIASALLRRGEAWMREQGLATACTYTDRDNTKLLGLYEKLGYQTEFLDAAWARASKSLV